MESLVVFFQCKNLEKTGAFYCQVCKMKLWLNQPGCKILDSGYGYLGFVENADFVMPSYSCISINCVDVDEVDQQYVRLKQYHPTQPKKHPNFPVYSFFVKDPDGYYVEFQKIIQEEVYE